MSNLFDSFDKFSGSKNKWIQVQSELEGLSGDKEEIKIELMEDGMPRAMAFFDIDGTMAHLSIIHDQAIQKLFPEANKEELSETYYKGFKLGNSFREFDRMRGIYLNGKNEWKDPEFYYQNHFLLNSIEIDEPGNLAHEKAASMLKEYGEVAAMACDDLYKNNPNAFKKTNIGQIFLLAKMFQKLGIPMVGFTANAKVFVEKLAKYLNLADMFLDVATDETMAGGGKEIAIHSLINELESKGVKIAKNRLIFVGDSLRGDIGSSLVAKEKDIELSGQGILVLENKKALIEIKKQINDDPKLMSLVRSIDVHGFIVDEVPLDEKGEPMLLSRYQDKFLEKL
ncbi:MAG: HAD family hydrolase [bacterium]